MPLVNPAEFDLHTTLDEKLVYHLGEVKRINKELAYLERNGLRPVAREKLGPDNRGGDNRPPEADSLNSVQEAAYYLGVDRYTISSFRTRLIGPRLDPDVMYGRRAFFSEERLDEFVRINNAYEANHPGAVKRIGGV